LLTRRTRVLISLFARSSVFQVQHPEYLIESSYKMYQEKRDFIIMHC